MTDLITIHRALLSVSDKAGVVDFARTLRRWNIQIISTGGTLKTLHEAGVEAKSISDVTGFPEILDGRVKTLHPKIHGGLLAVSDNALHMQQLSNLDIASIDLVVVNLYPFEQTIARPGVSLDEAIEQIDIGGPTMLRAAAKNYKYKTVVINPLDYDIVAKELEDSQGAICEATRLRLAREVFAQTSRYDTAISKFLSCTNDHETPPSLPANLYLSLKKSAPLRYGENPHQQAALYGGFHTIFEKLHGKELSYNNIVDIQAAAALVEEFNEPTVVIIKHTNPCGVGSAQSLADAYDKAYATDTKSAFGSIIAVNRILTQDVAEKIDKVFTEVIVAPAYDAGALEFLNKKRDRRIIRQTAPLSSLKQLAMKDIAGGVLVQTSDNISLRPEELRIVTKRRPNPDEYDAMMFGWRVAKHVKSNAIVYSRRDRTLGIGAGQMSRFDSSRIAVLKANEAGFDLKGSAVASDAFFPFADGLLEAAKAGATAVIQPGGSVRDDDVTRAADEHNLAMIMTGIRHFKH